MAIKDATGSITHNYKDVAGVLSSSSGTINGIVGGVGYRAGSGSYMVQGEPTGGGGGVGEEFAGISEDRISDFESAVNNYEQSINEIIRGFDATQNMEEAIQGSVADAASEFLLAIKQLLQRYVQAIEIEKREIREANANWKQASSTISSNVSGDSSDIMSEAEKVTIE